MKTLFEKMRNNRPKLVLAKKRPEKPALFTARMMSEEYHRVYDGFMKESNNAWRNRM